MTSRRVTGQGRIRMLTRFTAGDGPIVTSEASAWHHPLVIELRPRKGCRRFVAQFAGLCRRRMVYRFAPCCRAVMATRTARHDPRVTELRPRKGRRRFVARIAGLGRRNMRRGLASRLGTVVAGGASSRHHARVVVARGNKQPIRHAHSVAGIARKSCRHMPSRLPAGLNPVVAGRAGTRGHPHVLERGARPGHSSMATIARHRSREMRRGLSLCGTIVMAL
jgi:hypothetical protein